MRERISLSLFLMGSCALVSCGYTVRRSDVSLGGVERVQGQSQRIFVPIIDNVTVRSGAEIPITNSLRDALAGVEGLDVVSKPDDAQFFLLGTLTQYKSEPSQTIVGHAESAQAGGLSTVEALASEIRVRLEMHIELIQKLPENGSKRVVWARNFARDGVYETSRRFMATGSDASAGSASAPYINDSRESIQVKILAEAMARQVLDQVVQDF